MQNICILCDKKFSELLFTKFCSEACKDDHAAQYYDDTVMYEEEQIAFESDKL